MLNYKQTNNLKDQDNLKNASESGNVKILNEKLSIEGKNKDFIYKEGGWGWVVVIASGYCFGILIGMINNYALIYNELVKVHNGTANHVVYSGSYAFKKPRAKQGKINRKIILNL